MNAADVDAQSLIRWLNNVERQQFPFALATALNDTAFQDVRPGWSDEMLRVFDRPTRLTLRAPLVKRATKQKPEAEIYLRNEASKGTPPARYLVHHVEGGRRFRKPFENLLIRAGVMESNEYAVPSRSAPRDQFGNVPGRTVTAILSDIRASREAAAYSTRASRRRRERSRRRRGGVYFYSRGDRGLPRGIYERIRTGFGTAVRPVFLFVRNVNYRERYDVLEIAREIFRREFPKRFRASLARAVASAKKRSRGRRR